jgi:hypothetical protein
MLIGKKRSKRAHSGRAEDDESRMRRSRPREMWEDWYQKVDHIIFVDYLLFVLKQTIHGKKGFVFASLDEEVTFGAFLELDVLAFLMVLHCCDGRRIAVTLDQS